MGKTKTKKLVQGAMIAALFGVLSLLNTYTGSFFDVLICYGMVVPLVWYGYNYTLKDNILVCIAAMIVIAIVGLPFFIISAFSSCLAGMFIAEALKRKAKKEVILIGTLVITFLNNIVVYEIFAGVLNMNLMAEMKEMYEMLKAVPFVKTHMTESYFLSFAPLLLLIASAMEMYVIVLLCQISLYRFHIEFPGSFHIATLHLSKPVGVILGIALFGSYILKNYMHVTNTVVDYAYVIAFIALLLQGLSLATFYCIAVKKPRLSLLFMLGIFIPKANYIYVLGGFFDIFSDLRENILYNKHMVS